MTILYEGGSGGSGVTSGSGGAGGLSSGNGGGAGGYASNLSVSHSHTFSVHSSSSPYILNTSSMEVDPVISLQGKNADIKINGMSIKDALVSIESRLAILKPNPDLESRWDRLRELREEYQKVEAEIIEKETMWDKLK